MNSILDVGDNPNNPWVYKYTIENVFDIAGFLRKRVDGESSVFGAWSVVLHSLSSTALQHQMTLPVCTCDHLMVTLI
jgi:hypothetical protein